MMPTGWLRVLLAFALAGAVTAVVVQHVRDRWGRRQTTSPYGEREAAVGHLLMAAAMLALVVAPVQVRPAAFLLVPVSGALGWFVVRPLVSERRRSPAHTGIVAHLSSMLVMLGLVVVGAAPMPASMSASMSMSMQGASAAGVSALRWLGVLALACTVVVAAAGDLRDLRQVVGRAEVRAAVSAPSLSCRSAMSLAMVSMLVGLALA